MYSAHVLELKGPLNVSNTYKHHMCFKETPQHTFKLQNILSVNFSLLLAVRVASF